MPLRPLAMALGFTQASIVQVLPGLQAPTATEPSTPLKLKAWPTFPASIGHAALNRSMVGAHQVAAVPSPGHQPTKPVGRPSWGLVSAYDKMNRRTGQTTHSDGYQDRSDGHAVGHGDL